MLKKLLYLFLFLVFTTSCGIYKPVDARKVPGQAKDRARQNVNEGKGISINNIVKGNKNTNYEFSSSNPLWRATLQLIDFIPLSTVDYSGGVIITDWYSENNSKDFIKITIRFLSTEVRSDSIKIIIHKKNCVDLTNCKTEITNSKLKQELQLQILKKASELQLAQKIK